MKNTLTLLLSAMVLLAGCATKRDFYAMSGSRADGTVDMAYDISGPFDQPVVNMNQAASIAAQKCAVWGYRSAEPFGGQSERCNQRNGFGKCISGQMVIQFQCLGDLGTPSNSYTPLRGHQEAPAHPSSGAISKTQWRQEQLHILQQSGVSYEEYQRRYQEIMAD
jgi:hypothetical protein